MVFHVFFFEEQFFKFTMNGCKSDVNLRCSQIRVIREERMSEVTSNGIPEQAGTQEHVRIVVPHNRSNTRKSSHSSRGSLVKELEIKNDNKKSLVLKTQQELLGRFEGVMKLSQCKGIDIDENSLVYSGDQNEDKQSVFTVKDMDKVREPISNSIHEKHILFNA